LLSPDHSESTKQRKENEEVQ